MNRAASRLVSETRTESGEGRRNVDGLRPAEPDGNNAVTAIASVTASNLGARSPDKICYHSQDRKPEGFCASSSAKGGHLGWC
jgi:hypothetical protein